MDETKLYICLEAKHNNGGQHHVYLICSLRLNDLTTQLSYSPALTKEASFEGYPSMGCGFYESKIVFAGGQVEETDSAHEEIVEEKVEQNNHNGLITFDMKSKQLSSDSFPSMLRGKVKPLVFQLHDNLYVIDTISGYRQGSFEYFYPKKQEWNLLRQPAYDELVDEFACRQDRNYPCLLFGNACYLSISFDNYDFVYLHHPNITYRSWLSAHVLMPNHPLPFSGVATFFHQDDVDDFVVISFTKRAVRIHYFDLSLSFLQDSKVLFRLPASSESAELEEMSGYFADFGDGIFSLTAFDAVLVHVYTFQIFGPGNPEVFQLLSHYEYKCDALSFGVDVISVVGCFAPYPNVQAIKHAEKLLQNRYKYVAKRCDEDPANFEFDGVKFPVPEGCPGDLVSVSIPKSQTLDSVKVVCILSQPVD